MGREATCLIETPKGRAECKVHLDGESITIRGALRQVLPLKSLEKVHSSGDELLLDTVEGQYQFQLGEKESAAWVKAIQNPPTLQSKLGLKDGQRILAVGFSDHSFLAGFSFDTRPKTGELFDLIFLAAESLAELETLGDRVKLLAPKGALWIVSPKATKAIPGVEVIMLGRAAGLTDTKVCRFSNAHTAHRFIVKK